MTILAAVDENRSSREIVKVAGDLSEAFDERLAVLHVIPSEGADEHMQALRTFPEFKDMSISDEMGRAAEFAETIVEEASLSIDADRIEIHGEVGDPGEQVVKVADEIDARHLVIGGRKRSPVGKALFGSTTQSILLNANCPVTTVMTE